MRYAFIVAALGLLAITSHAQEVCDNAIDDDADGLIDLNDTTDCACTAVIGGVVNSIIPNASFEDHDCVPTWFSELDCASTWEQATLGSSDYFLAQGYMPPAVPQPLPDGDGCVGGFIITDNQGPGIHYLEYVGACLLQTMQAGVEYSLQFHVAGQVLDLFAWTAYPMNLGPVDITVYGLATCVPFPVGNDFGCPQGWTVLGQAQYQPSGTWDQLTISFTPGTDINAIMIGGPCQPPADYVAGAGSPYFFYDELTLNESALFGSSVTRTGSTCTNDVVLNGHPDSLAISYQWYRDGVAIIGQIDSLLNVSALGLDTGLYQFRTSGSGASCAIADYHLEADPYPVIAATATPSAGCAPLAVTFAHGVDTALLGTIVWDFGDGSTSADADPQHTYTEQGIYDVAVSVTSPAGCTADTVYADMIEVYAAPMASFTADVLEGCTGMTVNFSNTSAGSVACDWTFGDGTASNQCTPSHTYTTAGTFDVGLTVTSANGCVDDTLMTALITVFDAPDVSFTSDTIAGCAPLSVQFTNATPAIQVGTVEWDLGNGTITAQDDPATIYTEPGQYTVSLVVTHPLGCSAEVTVVDMITVYGDPLVSFTSMPDSGCSPLEVQFTNTTDPGQLSISSWHFGDGGASSVHNPVHVYTEPGTYTVSLSVISPQNCVGDTSRVDLITVFDHPAAGFSYSPQPTDLFNTEISFMDSSSLDVVDWAWSFGLDGVLGTSGQEHPVVHFPEGEMGTYPVELVVTNRHGCTDTLVQNVLIDGYYAVYVPNAFTPDGDGVNDTWLPRVRDQVERLYQVRVFDRWGEELWASTEPGQGWDGRSGGELLKTDLYVWKLETREALTAVRHVYIGHVSLLK